MSTAHIVWLAFSALLTLIWLRRHGDITHAHTTIPELGGDDPTPPESDSPRVSIIIAAKDEESGVEECIRSLLAQKYDNLEIIVVNDRSEDRTGEILSALEREVRNSDTSTGRLRVKTITELPPGWFGKTHAVQCGADDATGDYLLFTDADCVFTSQNAVGVAVQYARKHKIDLLSVIPHVLVTCNAEAVIQPVASAVLMLWHHPHSVNDPDRKVAYANGAFMLFAKSAYERIGGHHSVKNFLCEDMHLARTIKTSNLRLFVTQNRDLYHTTMYHNLHQTCRGWTRIFQGGLHSKLRILLATLVLVVFSLGPWMLLVAAAIGAFRTGFAWPHNAILVASAAAAAAQQSVTLRLYPVMRRPANQSWLYPIGAVLTTAILINAMLKSFGIGQTHWQGTTYLGSDLAPDRT